ncbi:RNA-binding protein 42-like [Argonauta hians]
MAMLTQEKLKEMEEEMDRFEQEILAPSGEDEDDIPRMIIGSNTYTKVQAQLKLARHPGEEFPASSPRPLVPRSSPHTSSNSMEIPLSVLSAPPPPPPPTSAGGLQRMPFPRLPPPPPPHHHMSGRPAFVPHQLRHRPPMPVRHPPMHHMGPRPGPGGGMPPPPFHNRHPLPHMMGGNMSSGQQQHPGGPPHHHHHQMMMSQQQQHHMQQQQQQQQQQQRSYMGGGPLPPGAMYGQHPHHGLDPNGMNPDSGSGMGAPPMANIEKPQVIYSAPPMSAGKKPPSSSDTNAANSNNNNKGQAVSSSSAAHGPSGAGTATGLAQSSAAAFQTSSGTMNPYQMMSDGSHAHHQGNPADGTADDDLMEASHDMGDMTSQQKKDKKEKKRKFIRTAAGQIWEDTTLNEWGLDDFRIFCGDLGNEVTDEILTRAFSKFASFVKAKVVRDKRSNKTKGYGFVSFRDPNDFVRAMREMNGKYVGNRPIKLRKSSWKERNIEIVRKKDKEKKRLGLR